VGFLAQSDFAEVAEFGCLPFYGQVVSWRAWFEANGRAFEWAFPASGAGIDFAPMVRCRGELVTAFLAFVAFGGQ
jgi:hypothetical protein